MQTVEELDESDVMGAALFDELYSFYGDGLTTVDFSQCLDTVFTQLAEEPSLELVTINTEDVRAGFVVLTDAAAERLVKEVTAAQIRNASR